MRVCVTLADQSFARTKSLGIFNVSRGLVGGLAACEEVDEVVVLVTGETAWCVGAGGKVRVVEVAATAPSGWRRVAWDQWGVVGAIDRTGADWVLFPKGFPPLWRWPRAKVCCYVHDHIFGFYRERGWGGFPAFERWYFPASLRRAASRAEVVVTNSAFSAGEVERLGREGVTRQVGIGFEAVGGAGGGGGGLLLLVSGAPHKLTAQAVDWVRRWKVARGSAAVVYGVGALPDGVDWPEGDDWVLCGRLDDAAYEALWGKVGVLLYFTAYEGFGMPPLEASLRGVRALASDLPVLRERVPAGSLFDNGDWGDFAAKLDDAVAGGEAGRFRVAAEGWGVVAARVVSAMGEV